MVGHEVAGRGRGRVYWQLPGALMHTPQRKWYWLVSVYWGDKHRTELRFFGGFFAHCYVVVLLIVPFVERLSFLH